jgi:hypothetical protein
MDQINQGSPLMHQPGDTFERVGESDSITFPSSQFLPNSVLRFDDDRSFDHTMNGHYTVEINTKSRHKLYTCTRCGLRMDGKNRALQHIAARKPPGSSLKSAKVAYCRNPCAEVKDVILTHWEKRDNEIKERDNNPEEFNVRKVFESAKKRTRRHSNARTLFNRSRAIVDDSDWLRNSHRSPILSRKGMHSHRIIFCF